MTALVLDSSIALCWCFEDESTEATRHLLEHLRTDTVAVPNLWHVEIALLDELEIDVDEETWPRAFTRVIDLAREERLTAYDAAYLELAMRLGVPLASKDADLCDAAQRLGVSVLRAD